MPLQATYCGNPLRRWQNGSPRVHSQMVRLYRFLVSAMGWMADWQPEVEQVQFLLIYHSFCSSGRKKLRIALEHPSEATKGTRTGSSSRLFFGQPWLTCERSMANSGQDSEAERKSSIENVGNPVTKATISGSRAPSDYVGNGSLDKQSAAQLMLPCRYTMSYV